MKILIAVPTFENITPDTFKSIYDLDKGEHECSFDFVRGYDCAAARNNIVQKILKGGFDYVLMVDNDVVLPKDALLNMLEGQKEICLGYYAHRLRSNVYDGRTCLCKLGEIHYSQLYTADEIQKLKDIGTMKFQIHGGGMGCALIKRSLLERLDFPWYKWVTYDDGHGTLSEDLYFCNQCNRKGIPIYADARVACGHLLRHVQWPTK